MEENKIGKPVIFFGTNPIFRVADLDGNALRIGSDSKPDRPPAEWLDMYGVRWKETAPRQWERLPSQST